MEQSKESFKIPKHYSNSRLSCYRRCRKKYYYSYLAEGIEEVEPSIGLRRGSAGHKFMEEYYQTKAVHEAKTKALGELKPEGEQEWKEWMELEKTLDRYVEFSSGDPWKTLNTELLVEAEVSGKTYMGIIDLLVEISGRRFIVDHKFNKQVSTRHLEMDPQVSYYYMLSEMTGMKISGIIYNIIRVGNTKKCIDEPVVRKVCTRSRPFIVQSAREVKRQTIEIDSLHGGELEIFRNPTHDCHWDCSFYTICRNDLEKGK